MANFDEMLDCIKERSINNKTAALIQLTGDNAEENLKYANELASHMSKDYNILEIDMSSEEAIKKIGVNPLMGLVMAIKRANIADPTTVIFDVASNEPDEEFQNELLYFMTNLSMARGNLELKEENLAYLLIIITKANSVNLIDPIDRRSVTFSTFAPESVTQDSSSGAHIKQLAK